MKRLIFLLLLLLLSSVCQAALVEPVEIDWTDTAEDLLTTGTGTFGNITIFNPTPILVFKDSTYVGDVSLGYIEWRDKNNTRLGFFGNTSSGNDDLFWVNESSGGHIKIETTGAGELQISANVDLGSNDLTTTGDLSAASSTLSGNLDVTGAITGTSFIIGGNTLTTTEWAILDDVDANQVIDWTDTTEDFNTTGTLKSGAITTTETLTITKAAEAATREKLIEATVSDADSSDIFAVVNTTASNTRFAPTFIGNQESDASYSSLYFTAQSDGTRDTGTIAYMSFQTRRYIDGEDYLNPTSGFIPIITRPLFRWRNHTTSVMQIENNGDVNNFNNAITNYTKEVTDDTDNETLTASQSSGVFTNQGDADNQIYTLPTAATGLIFTFTDVESGAGADLYIRANTDDTINGGTANEYYGCKTDAVGQSCTVIAVNATEWIVIAEVGTWVNDDAPD